jgi:hypothetical protein
MPREFDGLTGMNRQGADAPRSPGRAPDPRRAGGVSPLSFVLANAGQGADAPRSP